MHYLICDFCTIMNKNGEGEGLEELMEFELSRRGEFRTERTEMGLPMKLD